VFSQVTRETTGCDSTGNKALRIGPFTDSMRTLEQQIPLDIDPLLGTTSSFSHVGGMPLRRRTKWQPKKTTGLNYPFTSIYGSERTC
jgi:hypothetical protein